MGIRTVHCENFAGIFIYDGLWPKCSCLYMQGISDPDFFFEILMRVKSYFFHKIRVNKRNLFKREKLCIFLVQIFVNHFKAYEKGNKIGFVLMRSVKALTVFLLLIIVRDFLLDIDENHCAF